MTHTQPSYGNADVSDTYPTVDPRDQAESVEGPSRSPESIDVPADVTDNSESTRTPGEDDFDIDLGGESYRSSSEDDVSINLDFGGTSPEAPEVQESEIDLDFGTQLSRSPTNRWRSTNTTPAQRRSRHSAPSPAEAGRVVRRPHLFRHGESRPAEPRESGVLAQHGGLHLRDHRADRGSDRDPQRPAQAGRSGAAGLRAGPDGSHRRVVVDR